MKCKQELRMVLGEWRLVTVCPTKKAKGSRMLLTHKVSKKSSTRNIVAKQERLELRVFESCLSKTTETLENVSEEQIQETSVHIGDKETEQLGVEENHSRE
jgi:hypothetical protein